MLTHQTDYNDPLFQGTAGIPVEDWVEGMRTRRPRPVDQACFIYHHFEGELKDEIRLKVSGKFSVKYNRNFPTLCKPINCDPVKCVKSEMLDAYSGA